MFIFVVEKIGVFELWFWCVINFNDDFNFLVVSIIDKLLVLFVVLVMIFIVLCMLVFSRVGVLVFRFFIMW